MLTAFSPADPAHAADLDAFVALAAAADAAVWGDQATSWGAAELRSRALDPDADDTAFVLRQEGEAVAVAGFRRHLVDEPTLGRLTVAVRPDRQRRGLARRLHAAVAEHARARGVTRLAAFAEVPVDADRRPLTEAVSATASALGYRGTLPTLRNDLVLPLDPDQLARASAAAEAGMGGGYAAETCTGTPPPEWLAGLARLRVRMSTDTPSGLDSPPETWDEHRVLELARTREASGRLYVTAVVRDLASGELVGYSDISDSSADTVNGYQQDTLVLREHRGHRLGMALKLAATQRMVAERPGLRVIHTWNAVSNAPMLAVNEAVGFRPVGLGDEWVLDLS